MLYRGPINLIQDKWYVSHPNEKTDKKNIAYNNITCLHTKFHGLSTYRSCHVSFGNAVQKINTKSNDTLQ